jgi:hypothetical protein
VRAVLGRTQRFNAWLLPLCFLLEAGGTDSLFSAPGQQGHTLNNICRFFCYQAVLVCVFGLGLVLSVFRPDAWVLGGRRDDWWVGDGGWRWRLAMAGWDGGM